MCADYVRHLIPLYRKVIKKFERNKRGESDEAKQVVLGSINLTTQLSVRTLSETLGVAFS